MTKENKTPTDHGSTGPADIKASDLIWDVDGDSPVIDDEAADAETPKFLNISHRKSKAQQPSDENYKNNDVTETGSFDLTWLTIANFGRLLNAIPIPVLLLNEFGGIEFVNSTFESLLPNAKMVPSSFFHLVPSESDLSNIKKLLNSCLGSRKPGKWQGFLNIPANPIWCRLHIRSIRVSAHKSALILIEDLTGEKRELALNAKHKRLVDIFPIGIAEFALSSSIKLNSSESVLETGMRSAIFVDGNMRFAKLSGYSRPSELRGKTFGNVVPQSIASNIHLNWIRNQFSMIPFETKEIDVHGQVRYFENMLVGNVQDQSMNQFWMMKHDITERKKVQEELLAKIRTIDELYEHIVQSGKAKAISDHTAKVAHELRQPLAIIGGFSRRLAKEIQDEGLQELKIIINEVQRLEKILARLIDYTRHETVTLQVGSPNEVIQDILNVYKERFEEKRLKLETSFGTEIGEVPLDTEKFQQVVRSLVSNAIEASPVNGTIYLQTGCSVPSDKAHRTGELTSDAYFEFKVHNHGKKIIEEDLDRVFDPFYTTKSYGTGLGLTLSRKIVEDLSGSISVKSDETGTLFTVWIPIPQSGICSRPPDPA